MLNWKPINNGDEFCLHNYVFVDHHLDYAAFTSSRKHVRATSGDFREMEWEVAMSW